MLKKPKTVSSTEQLQSHLQRSGGSAEGILWETEVERDEHGEILVEEDLPVKGVFLVVETPDGVEPLVEFHSKNQRPEVPNRIVHDEDVLHGAVQVIARRLK